MRKKGPIVRLETAAFATEDRAARRSGPDDVV